MAYIRVSVHYSLDLKFYEVSEAEVKQRMQALENHGYSSYLEDGQLIVDDEIGIDDSYYSGKDISEEIIWLLGKTDSDQLDYEVDGYYSESEIDNSPEGDYYCDRYGNYY